MNNVFIYAIVSPTLSFSLTIVFLLVTVWVTPCKFQKNLVKFHRKVCQILPQIIFNLQINLIVCDIFSYLEPVCCSMSCSDCCFLTCIQISQEADQVVWYSHLFQNFPQFIVIHTVKGFGTVNKADIDVFVELSCFFDDPADVGNLISGSSAFSKTSLSIYNSWFTYC